MNRGAQTGGINKCRKFTRLVNIIQPMSGQWPTLLGQYCQFAAAWPIIGPIISQIILSRRTAVRQYVAWVWLFVSALIVLQPGQASARDQGATAQEWASESGTASYYGRGHQGRRTASGSHFDQKALTAAHPWLPFGTRVRVTLLGTGRSVVVVITDRLYSTRRVIDLSAAAARTLGMLRQGIATVELTPG